MKILRLKNIVTCPRSHKVASGRVRTGTQQVMPLSVRLLLVLLGDGLFAGLSSPPGLYLFGGAATVLFFTVSTALGSV